MPDEKPPNPAASAEPANDGAIASGAPAGAPPAPGAIQLPPIPLDPERKSPRAAPPKPVQKDSEVKDSFRELIETVVFVVVLVLMLKTFLAEAFVIPTGSMADTLLGYHFKVTCKECGYPNLVNASPEAEPRDPRHRPHVIRCECVNCKHINEMRPELVKGLPP